MTTTTLRQAIGIDGRVKADFVRGDWVLSPDRYIADRAAWDASRRSLLAILPTGATLRDGESIVTVRRDARGIIELIARDGSVWLRLSSSPTVIAFARDFGQAVIVTADDECPR